MRFLTGILNFGVNEALVKRCLKTSLRSAVFWAIITSADKLVTFGSLQAFLTSWVSDVTLSVGTKTEVDSWGQVRGRAT